jgi:hypothetical protein
MTEREYFDLIDGYERAKQREDWRECERIDSLLKAYEDWRRATANGRAIPLY